MHFLIMKGSVGLRSLVVMLWRIVALLLKEQLSM